MEKSAEHAIVGQRAGVSTAVEVIPALVQKEDLKVKSPAYMLPHSLSLGLLTIYD